MEVKLEIAPARFRRLMEGLMNSTLNQVEFQSECIKWLFEECWNDCMPYDLPQKTDDYIAYEGIPENDRVKLEKKYYIDHPEVMFFIDKAYSVVYMNVGRMEELRKLMEFAANSQDYEKLKGRAMLYEQKIYTQKQSLKKGYGDMMANEIAKEFGGSLA